MHTGTAATATSLEIRTFAGSGVGGSTGDGGPATAAQLRGPPGVAVRPSGTVFIADRANHRVRQVDGGTITTLAGTGTAGYAGDGGAASAAQLDDPAGVAVRPSGTVFIADAGSHTVRQVRAGVISTVAGRGQPGGTGDGGPAVSARLRNPQGVAARPSGELYIADTGNNAVRKVDLGGTISRVAGSGPPGYTGDGGAATSARLSRPAGVAVTPSGTLYIADTGNHVVRRVDTSGVVSTVAGSGTAGYAGDGGPATAAALREPAGVTIDDDGSLLIADTGNHVVRRVDPSGRITTLAGTGTAGDGGDGGPATTTPLHTPAGVASSKEGVLIAEAGGHRVRVLAVVTPPDAPVLVRTDPPSPANHNEPRILGEAPAGTTIHLHTGSGCAGGVVATGPAEALASPGLAVPVADDTTTTFSATATDAAGYVSDCSGPLTYVEDSTAPAAPEILSAPDDPTDRKPTWTFAAEPGAATTCQLASAAAILWPYGDCDQVRTYELAGLPDGAYTFSVRATDAAGNTGPAATSTHALATPPPPFTPGDPDEPGPTDPDPGDLGPGDPDEPGPTDPGAGEPRPGNADPIRPRPLTPEPTPDPSVSEPKPIQPVVVIADPVRHDSPPTAPTDPRSHDAAPTGPSSPEAATSAPTEPDADTAAEPEPPLPSVVEHVTGARPPTPDAAEASASDRGTPTSDPAERGPAFGAAQHRARPPVGTLEALASDIRAVGAAFASDPTFPLLLLLVVGVFLAVQHFIDRSDPKLALAPVDNAELEFPELLPVRNTPPHLVTGASSWSLS